MENYILNKKRLNLLKNKNFSFNIPVRIKPINTELIIEAKNPNSFPSLIIVFIFKSFASENNEKTISISVPVDVEVIKVILDKTNLNPKDNYLLLACTSNYNLNAELTIREL